GAMLLTRRVANGQEILFKEGQHLAAFATESELYQQIDHYLTHEEERARIAAAGLAEVRARHTLQQRLEQLLQSVEVDRSPVAPIRKMARPQVDGCYAAPYEQWSDVTAGVGGSRAAGGKRGAGGEGGGASDEIDPPIPAEMTPSGDIAAFSSVRLMRGLASSVLGQVLASMQAILLVPLFFRAWDTDQYGRWLAILAAVAPLA